MSIFKPENLTPEARDEYDSWLHFAGYHQDLAKDYRQQARELLERFDACCPDCDGSGWVGQEGSRINCPTCRPYTEPKP